MTANFESSVNETEDRLGKDQSYLLDSTKLRHQLKWMEQETLIGGLKETLNWVDKNLQYLSKLPTDYIHKK